MLVLKGIYHYCKYYLFLYCFPPVLANWKLSRWVPFVSDEPYPATPPTAVKSYVRSFLWAQKAAVWNHWVCVLKSGVPQTKDCFPAVNPSIPTPKRVPSKTTHTHTHTHTRTHARTHARTNPFACFAFFWGGGAGLGIPHAFGSREGNGPAACSSCGPCVPAGSWRCFHVDLQVKPRWIIGRCPVLCRILNLSWGIPPKPFVRYVYKCGGQQYLPMS